MEREVLADREKIKLVQRTRRVRGQIDAIERALESEKDCSDILMLLAAARGALTSLMAEVMEDHIRLHLVKDSKKELTPELAEDLIDMVRSYLK